MPRDQKPGNQKMGDQKLGPERRIRQRQDFLRIQSTGKKFRTKHFLMIISPRRESPGQQDGETPQSRIGITVTTKVNKRAARRNRLKRRIRDLFRRERQRFQQRVDMVIIALEGATELSYLQTVKQVKYLMYRSGVLPERGAAKGRRGKTPARSRKAEKGDG